MMVLSAPINEKIRQALATKDQEGIDTLVSDLAHFKDKKTRALMYKALNATILGYAFQHNAPEVLLTIRIIPVDGTDELFTLIIKRYTETKNKQWLDNLFILAEKMGKKSLKSKIVAGVIQNLISAGIESANPAFIETGLAALSKITFRKYRSECTIEAAFRITKWAHESGSNTLLFWVYDISSGINDISRRAALHAEIAEALAINAITAGDFNLFLKSLQLTSQIHQKIRRRASMDHIIGMGMRSVLAEKLMDIHPLLPHFEYLPPNIQGEIADSLTGQLLDRVKNKDQILDDLEFISRKMPFVRDLLVNNLLIKAERSGDPWYLTTAISFIQDLPHEEKAPVRDIVRAGSAIAWHTHSASILEELLPFIERLCDRNQRTGIYLQFVTIMIELGDFNHATRLFSKVSPYKEMADQYTLCLAQLLRMGILQDYGSSRFRGIVGNNTPEVVAHAISLAVLETGHTASFEDIAEHSDSLKQLLALQGGNDTVITDLIITLTTRGFLDSYDAVILVDLAKGIRNPKAREEAISTVVVKLAEIGVKNRNRDFLQQAVGITCLIEGAAIRSTTLNSIIDSAALLAATQGDLDLLLRMRIWSSSFLDSDSIAYAIKNIIDGVIKYAISKQDPDALDEAYRIAQDIEDPALRIQICERIAESFVRIGCTLLQESIDVQKSHGSNDAQLKPFRRSLYLLKAEVKKPRISLKIASMIDIILSFSKKNTIRDYILPLALYSLEIEDSLERNAMMLRIIAKLGEDTVYTDSADPYEILAYILRDRYRSQSSHEIINLTHRLLDLAQDPFVRLKGLFSLAEQALRIDDKNLCRNILDGVSGAVDDLTTEYQKILILAELAVGYCDVDLEKAQICLKEGLDHLYDVEPDQNTLVRRQLVTVLVRADALFPEKIRLKIILDIITEVTDPLEYVSALISAYTLNGEDRGRSTLQHISEALEKIDSPYNQALLILKLVPLAIQNGEDIFALDLLDRAERVSEKINIQHVADSIRDEIAGILSDLSKRQGNTHHLKKSVEILAHIEDDQLRRDRLAQLGFEDMAEKSIPYIKIMETMSRITENNAPPGQIVSLEQTVRSIPERGKRALIFCRLSIFSRDNGDVKIAKRMLQNAIKESGIIRPLSKRAYIRCDMAIKMYMAGYENVAQDILDLAIDAATNIRQSVLRDEVFDELGMAIRILQGSGPE